MIKIQGIPDAQEVLVKKKKFIVTQGTYTLGVWLNSKNIQGECWGTNVNLQLHSYSSWLHY